MKKALPMDKEIGGRVRSLRMIKGMSQTDLGTRCGITFQQVQKYEKGDNRIGGSRLKQIADALGVEVSYFFGKTRGKKGSPAAEMSELVNRSDTVRLLRAFDEIDGPARVAIVKLVESMAVTRN